jgi:hypothetical protein
LPLKKRKHCEEQKQIQESQKKCLSQLQQEFNQLFNQSESYKQRQNKLEKELNLIKIEQQILEEKHNKLHEKFIQEIKQLYQDQEQLQKHYDQNSGIFIDLTGD